MLIAVKIGVVGVLVAFVFVLFVLIDALDAMYTSSCGEDRKVADEFNRTVRRVILFVLLPLGGLALCAAGFSLIVEIFGL